MHLVLGFRVVMAFSSSSMAPGVFFSFLTSCRIAFSHNLLWLSSEAALILFAAELDAPSEAAGSAGGFTLKPSSFLTTAGVIYKLEKCVVSIDMIWFFFFTRLFKKKKNFLPIDASDLTINQ